MLAEGSTIGTYRVVRQLGEGGMGVVYLGEHTLLGRKAAIKVLLPEFSTDSEIIQRFFNEARAVTQIADPGIVQVFDFGHHSTGSAFIVMELLEGEAMDKRLARIGRFAPVDAMRLMRMICSSLSAAHAKGIVHRDLKPDNIFIVGDPAVTGGERTKILDFGIAKLSKEEPGKLKTRAGAMLGTPVFMSPEQCSGAVAIDHRSDIYSIGCVLFTMLTGAPPFDGDGSGDIMAAHLREPAPLVRSRVPGLPEILDQILQRCLAKAPGDRFQSMAELAESVGQAEQLLLRTSAMTIIHTPVPTSSMATPRRSRGVIVAVALAGVAIGGVTLIALTRHGGAARPPAPPVTVVVPAVADAPAAAPISIDASVPEPAAILTPAIDAGVAVKPRLDHTYKPKPPSFGRDHAQETGSNTATHVDRGD